MNSLAFGLFVHSDLLLFRVLDSDGDEADLGVSLKQMNTPDTTKNNNQLTLKCKALIKSGKLRLIQKPLGGKILTYQN